MFGTLVDHLIGLISGPFLYILQDLIVLCDNGHKVRANLDYSQHVHIVRIFWSTVLECLEAVFVEVRQLVDEVGVQSEDQVKIADSNEDDVVKQNDQLLEVIETAMLCPSLVNELKEVDVHVGSALFGVAHPAVGFPVESFTDYFKEFNTAFLEDHSILALVHQGVSHQLQNCIQLRVEGFVVILLVRYLISYCDSKQL